MTEKMTRMRQRLADIFCEIVEKALRRISPFNDTNCDINDYNYVYKNYLKLKDNIDESLSSAFLEAIIERTKFAIRRDLTGILHEFADMYPNHSKSIIALHKQIKDSGLELVSDEDVERMIRDKEESINVARNVKKVFKEILPDFEFFRKGQTVGELRFTKTIYGNHKILIIVDTGTWRSWLHFLIGIFEPEVLIDINEIFLLDKCTFDYKSEEELVGILDKAGGLINKVAGIIQAKMEGH